ncbi:MAG: flagellar basal body P-ring formation chaperone FlgA [Mariprofundaceae bacterium]
MPKIQGYPKHLSVIAEQRYGDHVRRWYVPVTLRWKSTVVAVKKSMRRGHILQVEDLLLKTVDVTNQTGLTYNMTDIVGSRLIRPVNGGHPVAIHMVAMPPLIHRGDWVTVVAQSGGLRVTARGKAMKDAKRGELMTVRSYDKKRYIQGRVLSASVVTVALGG